MNTYFSKCVLFPGLLEAAVARHSLFFRFQSYRIFLRRMGSLIFAPTHPSFRGNPS